MSRYLTASRHEVKRRSRRQEGKLGWRRVVMRAMRFGGQAAGSGDEGKSCSGKGKQITIQSLSTGRRQVVQKQEV